MIKPKINKENTFHYQEAISDKIEGFWHIIPAKTLRKTNKVDFKTIPVHPKSLDIEKVHHQAGALSPGKVDDVEEPWYMHPHQEDNLFTVFGVRHVELYNTKTKEFANFDVSPDWIKKDGEIILDSAGSLGWVKGIFHRNKSHEESIAMNLGIKSAGFDIDTEFNIYDIDMKNDKVIFLRKGSLDQ